MAVKSKEDLYQVSTTFIGRLDNAEVAFHVGEIVRADNPAVRKWPEFFGPLIVRESPIEQATAAPGEKRG